MGRQWHNERVTSPLRADAARNADAVLRVGAEVLARDPGASIASIAAEAGLDRTTVYRRFPNRDALLSAVYKAKLDGAEAVFEEARLDQAPIVAALHRFAEGIIRLSRAWPVEMRRMREDPLAAARQVEQIGWIDAFVARAVEEGVLRADLPEGWARNVLRRLMDAAAHDHEDLEPGPAADLVVATLLEGLGAS
jgi:AcrR family transcriptional regulator